MRESLEQMDNEIYLDNLSSLTQSTGRCSVKTSLDTIIT